MSAANNSGGCTYRFIESSLASLPEQINYDIEIRQQPERAKVSLINERDRRPIEPPPILQLHWENCSDEEIKKSLQSPFYFTVANLVTEEDTDTPLLPAQDYMSGSTVSSLYRLRDVDNSDGGFFVFGDLAVKKEGKFKLKFSLFEIVEDKVQNRRTLLSDTFTVFLPKHFPGPVDATFLSRTFSDQGVKMRIRKEHRLQSRKRKNEPSSSSNSQPVIKKHTSKNAGKMIVSSPPYAEPSVNTASDVFFGRWQATTKQEHHNIHNHNNGNTRCITPPITKEPEHHDLKNKFRYQQSNPTQAFPSPESTIYQPVAKSWTRTSSVESNRAPLRDAWTATYHSPPSLIASSHFTESPPTLSMQLLPSDASLDKYHTCSDNSMHRHSRLPSPPPSISELHTSWGTQLPPLRSIMDGLHQKNHPHSSLFPLLLPPPTIIEPHAHYHR